MAAAMKIRPPRVTIEPPKLTDPHDSDAFEVPANCGMLPNGTSQVTSPVARFTAVNAPQGGGLQGVPPGERRISRYMAYGVPDWRPNSPLMRFPSPDALS